MSGRTVLAACVIAVLMLCGDAFAAPADTLFLKDNSMRVGTIMSQDSAYTSIRTSGDLLVISAAEITRIGRERKRDLLLPPISVYLNGGMSEPSQFNFPSGFGLRLGGRYMLTRSFGLNLSFTYAAWQFNYDTTMPPGPNHNIKDPITPITRTFGVAALSPRVGVFMVASLAPMTRAILGVDVGQTMFSLSSQDTSAETQSSFSYALRGDMRFGLTDRFALLLGVQYEGFSSSFSALERHDVTLGPSHRVADILLSAGAEIGF